jgi:hypothetical protein
MVSCATKEMEIRNAMPISAILRDNPRPSLLYSGSMILVFAKSRLSSLTILYVVLFLAGIGVTAARAQTPRAIQLSPKVIEVLNMPPLEIKDDDSDLLRLRKQRFNAALNEAKARYTMYKNGLTRLTDLIEVGQRVLGAQADLALTPEERTTVLEKQLEIYNEAEENLDKQVKAGRGQAADLERLRYDRLGIEIDLAILKKGLSQ